MEMSLDECYSAFTVLSSSSSVVVHLLSSLCCSKWSSEGDTLTGESVIFTMQKSLQKNCSQRIWNFLQAGTMQNASMDVDGMCMWNPCQQNGPQALPTKPRLVAGRSAFLTRTASNWSSAKQKDKIVQTSVASAQDLSIFLQPYHFNAASINQRSLKRALITRQLKY